MIFYSSKQNWDKLTRINSDLKERCITELGDCSPRDALLQRDDVLGANHNRFIRLAIAFGVSFY